MFSYCALLPLNSGGFFRLVLSPLYLRFIFVNVLFSRKRALKQKQCQKLTLHVFSHNHGIQKHGSGFCSTWHCKLPRLSHRSCMLIIGPCERQWNVWPARKNTLRDWSSPSAVQEDKSTGCQKLSSRSHCCKQGAPPGSWAALLLGETQSPAYGIETFVLPSVTPESKDQFVIYSVLLGAMFHPQPRELCLSVTVLIALRRPVTSGSACPWVLGSWKAWCSLASLTSQLGRSWRSLKQGT